LSGVIPEGVHARLLARRSGKMPWVMLTFAADENFNNDGVRGLLRRNPAAIKDFYGIRGLKFWGKNFG